MKRTSYSIQRKIVRLRAITAHISPYLEGLAPETRQFAAVLNAEAIRCCTGVQYLALANRIEARGRIERAAASTTTLGGWFLRQAIQDGYLNGEEAVLRPGNSSWRKRLRKRAKTRPAMRARLSDEQQIRYRMRTRQIAEAGDAYIGPSSLVPGKWPKAWLHGLYMPILHPHKPRDTGD